MKAIIIDDEAKARNLLRTILVDFCADVNQVEEASNLPDGVELIRAHKPDVVFLDIEMPEYNGTEILEFFDPEEVDFHIVFTTAYKDFAIQAFEMNAVDYLLKPMRPAKVKEAVKKVAERMGNQNVSAQLAELKQSFRTNTFTKLGLPVSDGIAFIELDDIICMQADGMYTNVFTTNGEEQVVSKPLKYFTDILKGNADFYRPHRTYLINIKHIQKYIRKDGNYIVMANDKIVSISKEKRDEFLDIAGNI